MQTYFYIVLYTNNFIMLHVIQIIRYIVILILTFLILIQNPRIDNINSLGRVNQSLNTTRNTESLLHNMTWLVVLIFLFCSIFLAALNMP